MNSIKISKKRLISFFAICIFILISFFIYSIYNLQKYQTALFFLWMLTIAITGFFIFHKKIILFEPIVLFSAYYLTVVIAGFYSISTDFANNVFVKNTSFNNDIPVLMAYACMYLFFGYICTLLGYYLVKKNNLKIEIIFEPKNIISDNVIDIFIIAFLVIGIGNFIYNIWIYAGGSLVQYMSNVSIRSFEFESSGTTLGYLFAYNAMYIWFFKLARKNIYCNKLFLIILIITIMIKASTGRIFSTMLYTASFVGIYYFIQIGSKRIINNAKYYIVAIGLAVCSILFYFLRIISSLSYNEMLTSSIMVKINELFKLITYFAVDKGNMPNIGVLMKIIDSWGNDIGYLYGQSLITWIFNFLPSSIRPESYQPSVIIKQTWYPHIMGGNLPPTGIGEMYANFGFFGPFIGMFLFGCMAGILYNYMIKRKSFWVLAIYIQIAVGFIMLYPKGEFDNLTLWFVLPIMFLVLTIKIISYNKTYRNKK